MKRRVHRQFIVVAIFVLKMAEGRDIPIAEQGKKPGKLPPWWKRLWGWTGFGEKKLWDWLQLLVVPLALAGIGLWFTIQQNAHQQEIEALRDKRAQALAEQQRQYTAVQEYMDKMSELMLSDKEGGLHSSKEGSALRQLARARTLTVVFALNGERKRIVVTFLDEARLLEAPKPIVDIWGADLQDAQLQGNPYVGIDLDGTRLYDGADKDGKGALLYDCDLRDAHLHNADLTGAVLFDARLNDGPDEDKVGAGLTRANLTEADLSNADLSNANLSKAILYGADLSDADLSGADLSDADLSEATGWTEEQLTSAKSPLEGAIMPDGQTLKSADNPDWPTFEEWLKSKSSGEDGENTGPS